MPTGERTYKMKFFHAENAASIDHDGIMSPPDIDRAVHSRLDIRPLADGQRVNVLFRSEG